MSQFQHRFPEVQDGAMQMINGLPIINGVPFEKLRLHQLRNLARAWKINVDLDAPKPDILPALTAAARQGVFRHPPSLPYYAFRAQLTGDEKGAVYHPEYPHPDGVPVPKALDPDALPSEVKVDKENDPFRQMYAQWSYADLKLEAKRIKPDLNLYGVSRASLGRLLYENGVTPSAKPVHADHKLE